MICNLVGCLSQEPFTQAKMFFHNPVFACSRLEVLKILWKFDWEHLKNASPNFGVETLSRSSFFRKNPHPSVPIDNLQLSPCFERTMMNVFWQKGEMSHLHTWQLSCSKVHESAIKETLPFSITIGINRHAFHSFRARNHAGMAHLGHFIIATALLYNKMTKEIFVAWALQDPWRSGALSF